MASAGRYRHLVTVDQMHQWMAVFAKFDRDGSSAIDTRELGLMMREVGCTPTDAELELIIEEVDIDKSDTIDKEEFCLLMLRQQRIAACPDWLYEMLRPPDLGRKQRPKRLLPTIATLNDGQYDAAGLIQYKVRQRIRDDGGVPASPRPAAVLPGPASPSPAAPGPVSPGPGSPDGVYGNGQYVYERPNEFRAFDSTLILTVTDLLPSAAHLRVAQFSGHGVAFGPFAASELLWRLATSTRTSLEVLEIAYNGLGDAGALAFAEHAPRIRTLVVADLSGNGIGARGAEALHRLLSTLPLTSRLETLRVDANPFPPSLHAAIAMQSLANQLPGLVAECRDPAPARAPVDESDAPLPAPPAASEPADPVGAAATSGTSNDAWTSASLRGGVEGWPPSLRPSVVLREIAELDEAHMAPLGRLLATTAPVPPHLAHRVAPSATRRHGRRSVASLSLLSCPRLHDAALVALLAPPAGDGAGAGAGTGSAPAAAPAASAPSPGASAPADFLRSLRWLRLSSCRLGDACAQALCRAADAGRLDHLQGLSLDANDLRLAGAVGTDATAVATQMGAALRSLPRLAELDLSANPKLLDAPAAALCAALLKQPARKRAAEPPRKPYELPHGLSLLAPSPSAPPPPPTRRVDAAAEPPPLRSLHLGGTGAGDATARAVAATLRWCQLRQLCVSGDVGDRGAFALADALADAPACPLRELWLGCRIGDHGANALAEALSGEMEGPGGIVPTATAPAAAPPPSAAPAPAASAATGGGCALAILGLGGVVRGGVRLWNSIEAAGCAALASALYRSSLEELTLAHNGAIGGEACVALLGALGRCSSLRRLDVGGCGLNAEHGGAIMAAMEEVWCLHTLVVEPAASGGLGGGVGGNAGGNAADKGGACGGSGGGSAFGASFKRKLPGAAPVLNLRQRLQLATLLASNQRQGKQRVDASRLSRSLDEVAWVFSSLCASLPKAVVSGPLRAWDGAACAQLAVNVGLPQYAPSFAANLRGSALASLAIGMLAQLGVTKHEHQKVVMRAVRDLVHAYARREAVARAHQAWALALASPASGDAASSDKDVAADAAPSRAADGADHASPSVARRGKPTPPQRSPRRGRAIPREGARARPRAHDAGPDGADGGADGGALTGVRTRLLPTPSQRPDPALALAGDGLPQLSPRRGVVAAAAHGNGVSPFGAGAPTSAAVASADLVGQLSSARDGTAAMPPASWLHLHPESKRQHAAPPVHRNARAAGRSTKRELRRDAATSRRILASLEQGGRLAEPTEALPPAFVAPRKHEIAWPTNGQALPKQPAPPAAPAATKPSFEDVSQIRRRLGLGPRVSNF